MFDVAVTTEAFATPADIELANTIADGDQDAFVALMRRFNGRLYRTARSIVPDDPGAESAVESAWLRAYRTIRTFSGETTLSIWLMRIVVGEALVRLRNVPGGVLKSDQKLVRPGSRETRKRTRSSNVNSV